MPKPFYAVRKGHKTGVFTSWSEVHPLIAGFSGALYKGFETKADALDWLGQKPADPDEYDLVAYTDGSNRGDGTGVSWGFALYDHGELVRVGAGRLTEADARAIGLEFAHVLEQRNIAGELYAAAFAAACAGPYREGPDGPRPLLIRHDYLGVAEYAEGRWKRRSALAQWYHSAMPEGVVFDHVKGHTGTAGNELADRLAGAVMTSKRTI